METKILNDFYDFTKWFMLKTAKFPRNYRYTFGEKIENLMLGLLEQFIEAKFTKERQYILIKINKQLELLRYYIRLSHDLKLFTDKSYEYSSKQINGIGAQLGGWLKEQNKHA
jgi:hypothetical protein